MSMGPLGGVIGSAAGAPRSQLASDTERTQHDTQTHARQTDAAQQAESASGIGQTQQDQESSERDADGRRLWEAPAKRGKSPQGESAVDLARQSKDSTGQSGNQLDLTG